MVKPLEGLTLSGEKVLVWIVILMTMRKQGIKVNMLSENGDGRGRGAWGLGKKEAAGCFAKA